jgi:beta-lactamase class D
MRRTTARPSHIAAGFLMVAAMLVLGACMSMRSPPALSESVVASGVDPATSTLVIYRLEDGETWTSNEARARQRFSPASTSKIAHTLIAIEIGAVTGPDEMFKWDGQTRAVAGWNEDQTFADAFRRSTVWIFQTVTPRIGSEALAHWLDAFGYGNADVGPAENVTQYWLTGPLAISAVEQVSFLSRLARRTLPLSARTYDLAVPVMAMDSGDGWTLYGKTGWKSVEGEPQIGWFVGWLEQTGGDAPGTYAFAFNMDMAAPASDVPKRKAVVLRALSDLGALPAAR